MNPLKKKFIAKVRGGPKHVVFAVNEREAIQSLIKDYQVNIYKLEYLTDQEVDPEFVAQVGDKDYTVTAPSSLAALKAFALMGLDMNKLTNLRRR